MQKSIASVYIYSTRNNLIWKKGKKNKLFKYQLHTQNVQHVHNFIYVIRIILRKSQTNLL